MNRSLSGSRPAEGEATTYAVNRDGREIPLVVDLSGFPVRPVVSNAWGLLLFAVVLLVTALFVFVRRAVEPVSAALLILASAIFANVVAFASPQVLDFTDWRDFLLTQTLLLGGYVLFVSALVHLALVFPRPLRIAETKPILIPATYLLPLAAMSAWIVVSELQSNSALEWFDGMDDANNLITVACFLAALAALIKGYRSAEDMVTRLQFRWVTFAFAVAISIALAFGFVPLLFGRDPLADWNWFAASSIIVPMAIAISILRYRLFDIDVIISRTLVWGTLTLAVIGIYLTVVGVISAYLLTGNDLVPALIATAIVALVFQPLRSALQRRVTRLVFGDRDEPYQAVTRLSQRLQGAIAPDSLLPVVAETVASALKLPYVEISLLREQGQVVAAVGQAQGELLSLPLTYHTEPIGTMRIAPRTPGETFSPADRALLEELARHVSAAAQAVRLSEDLRASRQRIVAAREEERRRLRRDLHDGLAPSLASLALKLEAARSVLPTDPAATDAILADLGTQTQEAIASIRHSVYGLRPPALDELGLVSALRERAARLIGPQDQSRDASGVTPRIEIRSLEPLLPMPAAVEVATFWIVSEAMTNVLRHANATHCVVTIRPEPDLLVIEVADDGIGLSDAARPGVGLSSMRERAEEVGGSLEIIPGQPRGLVIRAIIPRA